MREFGLIGYPLSHSFSEKYFANKFEREGIKETIYSAHPLENINQFADLLKANPELIGLNVTIPYKEQIIPLLDELEPKAKEIGAVNTIKIEGGKLIGYNTDYFGFKDSLVKFIGPNPMPEKALILGTGGASKAVEHVLKDLEVEYQFVSRKGSETTITYEELNQGSTLNGHCLIINSTPLGTHPNVEELPNLPYEQLTTNHFLFDLVYNPLVTAFMQKGIDAKCWVKNGLEMLHGQAEKAWEIWNQ